MVKDPRVSNFYRLPETGSALSLMTPLARGADRIAAREARRLGIPYDVPMPFALEEYEKDFTGSVETCPQGKVLSAAEDLREFRDLLSDCRGKVMLDGARSLKRGESGFVPGADLFSGLSYQAVGRFVVRHCDLLIAVWDGSAARGRGGAQEIVEFASRAGVPVWWVHATEAREPVWISDKLDLYAAPRPRIAAQALEMHLALLLPAPPAADPGRPLMHAIVKGFHGPGGDSASEYFQEQCRPPNGIWKTHAWIMKRLTGSGKRSGKGPVSASGATQAEQGYWHRLQSQAGRLAEVYAARYRSSYVLIILLAASSLIVGAGVPLLEGTAYQEHSWYFSGLECVLLSLTVWIFGLAASGNWHRKSIEYRLLAELFRKQKTLGALGWALPIAGVEHLADCEWLSWVAWLLAATQRASPFPQCEVDDEGRTQLRIQDLRALLLEQIEYHDRTEKNSVRAAERLEWLGSVLFLALGVLALAKFGVVFWREASGWMRAIELLGVVFASLSAAALALRSYAELQVLAEQSRTMKGDLKRALARTERIDPARALASQALGEEAAAVAALMLQDLEGWGRIFRGKLVELS